MASINLERITCQYLKDAILNQYDSATNGVPTVPADVVVPGGEVNHATTKQKVSFRGQCSACEVRFSGEGTLRQIEGAHIQGDSRRRVSVYSVIYPSISVQKSGFCKEDQTSA